MSIRHGVWGCGLAALLTVGSAQAAYTSLYTFGDSLSDSGNLYNLVYALTDGAIQVPPPPYYEGRASDGPVAVEYLAMQLGLSAAPVITREGVINPAGTNFAVLGSATGTVIQSTGGVYGNYMTFRYNPDLPNVSLRDQAVDGYLFLNSGVADPGALYFLWGGANDAYLALEDPGVDSNDASEMNRIAAATAAQAAANVVGYIAALADAGARSFLVPNLPDLGRTPDARFGSYGSAYAGALTFYTDTFNRVLGELIDGLAAESLRIVEFDVAALFDAFLADPSINTTTPCLWVEGCYPALTSQFLFWDGVHPTTAYHRILGEAMAAAVLSVPEPATLALLVAAVSLLAAVCGCVRPHSHT